MIAIVNRGERSIEKHYHTLTSFCVRGQNDREYNENGPHFARTTIEGAEHCVALLCTTMHYFYKLVQATKWAYTGSFFPQGLLKYFHDMSKVLSVLSTGGSLHLILLQMRNFLSQYVFNSFSDSFCILQRKNRLIFENLREPLFC